MRLSSAFIFLALASLGHADLSVSASAQLSPVAAALSPNEAALARYYSDVASQGKFEELDSLLDPAFSSDAAYPGMKKGPLGLRDFLAALRLAFPDASLEVQQMLSQGDWTACRYRFSGTQKGKFFGIHPTHKQVLLSGVDLWQFQNGRIIQQHGNFDSLGLLVQLGLAPELK